MYVFDIDGTLADCSHRLHHVKKPKGEKKNWPAFFAGILDDEVIESTLLIYEALKQMNEPILLCTGRPETYRRDTEQWLYVNGIRGYKALIMRGEKDSRPDFVSKKEALLDYLGHDKISSVTAIFEDRLQVCEAWRELGIPVFVCGDEWRKRDGD